uniref:PAX-interacting protein 1 n=1 Tax=Gouania willdenowi TaxID=441366 RepID=A0A8C5GH50_GOUWI
MSDEEGRASDELFKDVKFYVVGDIDPKVVQLLKSGKGKEVSYNALATHIIAEDGDNPEVGESREVFDLPVVKGKPSLVILSRPMWRSLLRVTVCVVWERESFLIDQCCLFIYSCQTISYRCGLTDHLFTEANVNSTSTRRSLTWW